MRRHIQASLQVGRSGIQPPWRETHLTRLEGTDGHHGGADTLEVLEGLEGTLITDVDCRARAAAARDIGRLRQSRSSPALIKALGDPCPAVRHEAVEALGLAGGDGAEEALQGLLCSRSPHVRSSAARALIGLRGLPREARSLFDLLPSGDEAVMDALASLGPGAVSFLRANLVSGPFWRRSMAAQSLAYSTGRAIEAEGGSGLKERLASLGLSPGDIGDLYVFKEVLSGGALVGIENTGFDEVSRLLIGRRAVRLCEGEPEAPGGAGIKRARLEDLLDGCDRSDLRAVGRTLVADWGGDRLAIKLWTRPGDEARLLWEERVMTALAGMGLQSTLPRPIGVFDLDGLPAEFHRGLKISGESRVTALCYRAGRGYFTYLNDPGLNADEVRKGVLACSRDLGRLTSWGMIHTSLIPLYHCREDGGQGGREGGRLYVWHRKVAGRLEGWLQSCMYPNLRISGIADLEHIEVWPEAASSDLQFIIGEHLLSIALVLGSYFRSRGLNAGRFCGEAFDGVAAASILREAFEGYHLSLMGRRSLIEEVVDWDAIGEGMEREMSGPGAGTDLGARRGPFPIPGLIRAVHLASLFGVLDLRSGEAAGQTGQG